MGKAILWTNKVGIERLQKGEEFIAWNRPEDYSENIQVIVPVKAIRERSEYVGKFKPHKVKYTVFKKEDW